MDTMALIDMDPQLVCFVVEYTKDFNRLRAARASGIKPSELDSIMETPDVVQAIAVAVQRRNEITQLDAEWVLTELADNHIIAKQTGQLGVSNKALELIGKLSKVDAFAATKLDLSVSDDIVERLQRGRERASMRTIEHAPSAPADPSTKLPDLPYAAPAPSSPEGDTPSFL